MRAAIAECFEEYVQAVPDKLTFVWNTGKAAQAITMAKPIAVLATLLTREDRFDFDYVGGKEPTDASLYQFSVVGLRQRQEKAGNRGFNALSFSWPSATGGRTHLFIAAPNAFTFYLGRHVHGLKPVTLYEFDFERHRSGTYEPSLSFPEAGIG
ncbi:SAVED domain-containing protein [Burkholderia cenocepacia]|uniref:SAVED domain-containing protein n=1 Tax=Burkholderia cenocepacia TaxID=95486 RepID=UPI002AB7E662|nr:SAVED domain-containing protein [Burkholderia cenocepacia]